MMWSLVTVCLLLPIGDVFGQKNVTGTVEANKVAINQPLHNDSVLLTESGSFMDDMMDWASSAVEYINEKSLLNSPQNNENGRKLKYKKGEIRFMMKTLLIFKTIFGLFLPLGIIASKILSWKAVTLSLMAFMLAKILFIKNLLSGKSPISVTPTNYVPPYYIQNGPNDLIWKRTGEGQNGFAWTQT